MEWISVKDELPKKEVIAYGHQGEMLMGYISRDLIAEQLGQNMFTCSNDNETLEYVTHWMPLPKPPNKENRTTK